MPHRTELTVTWSDTDAGGLIYYPQFFSYVVVGLNDYFAPAVAETHLMEHLRRDGYALPAVEASASFASPLHAGDRVVVETTVEDGESSMTVAFKVVRVADGKLAAEGEVIFVLVDETFDAVPLPSAVRKCIQTRRDTD